MLPEGFIQLIEVYEDEGLSRAVTGRPEDVARFQRLEATEDDWAHLADRLHVTLEEIG